MHLIKHQDYKCVDMITCTVKVFGRLHGTVSLLTSCAAS